MSKVDSFLKEKTWAVVGVSPNKFKFGYKIWKILKDNGYRVYPVNPFYDEVDGEKVYDSLEAIGEAVDVVDMVVPPKATMDYVKEADKLGIDKIWFQPDTFNDEIIELVREKDIEYIDDDCVLKVLTERNS